MLAIAERNRGKNLSLSKASIWRCRILDLRVQLQRMQAFWFNAHEQVFVLSLRRSTTMNSGQTKKTTSLSSLFLRTLSG